jgi:hypothetical protein
MVTYVIASKAQQPYLAECQMLGEFLEENCPDVSVKVVIKHNSDWNEFIDATCRSFGFYERTCPIVYTIEGTLIGDGANFVEHVRDRYGKVLGITKENAKRRTNDNVNKINDDKRKSDHGLTLAEKIEKLIDKVKKKEVVSHIDDAFYSEVVEQGVVFYVRKTNLQRETGRTKDVVDEIEVAEKKKIEEDRIEAARDMEYEEFKEKFEDHILGKAVNERDVGSDDDAEDQPNASKGAELKSH